MGPTQETINTAKQLYGLPWISSELKKALENDFPELKESEDERIRKMILDLVKKHSVNSDRCKMEAWLEKQKELWTPSKEVMDVLFALAYITNEVDDQKDDVITRLYQDLKREFFNGASYENMFPKEEKQKEQKPARWLDGDMREARQNLIVCCRDWERGENTTLLPIVATRARYFLEHLVEPQKPAEWSEEDEKRLVDISWAIRYCAYNDKKKKQVHDWFENRFISIRPQPHWKPSEEQMKCLEDCVNRAREMHNASTSGYDAYHTLSSLYNDLEKL